MKKLVMIFSIILTTLVSAQNTLPKIEAKDISGQIHRLDSLGFDSPIIISFWATWCAPCKKELNTLSECYSDWQTETGVKIIAISIDDQKTITSVPVYVNGKSWDFIVLLDPNGDVKRAMGVNNVPHTFLVNKSGEIVYNHNNYAPGDEEILYQELLKLKNND